MVGFGSYVKIEREKRNWTQTEFGAKIGINTSAISRIENGSQIFSKSNLKLLSTLFDENFEVVNNLFFADKFARECINHKCSDTVFSTARDIVNYYKNINAKQGEIKF